MILKEIAPLLSLAHYLMNTYTVLHMSIFGLCELAHQLMPFKERHGQFGEAKYSYPSRFEVPGPVPWAKTSKIRMIWFADSVLGHLNALNI